jgi:hypothetical protein
MIVIAGDSWGKGEWQNNVWTHEGLEGYLRSSGHKVINASLAGASPGTILSRLELTFESLKETDQIKNVVRVFVFQTEWVRDFRLSLSYEIGDLISNKDRPKYVVPTRFDNNISTLLISRWYCALSSLAGKYNVDIGLIGGCSDTLNPTTVETVYPKVYVACQSLTNLCIYGVSTTDYPVFVTGSVSSTDEFFDACKKKYSAIDSIVELIDQSLQRRHKWDQHPEWFKPDGIHANRDGHLKLYNYLKEQYNI